MKFNQNIEKEQKGFISISREKLEERRDDNSLYFDTYF